jgi:signal peptidase I
MKTGKIISIFKSFSECVFSALVFVFIPIIFLTLISSRTTFLGGVQSFTVLSGSMNPLIPTGSVVYTMPVMEPKVGEIITFKKGNINVTHRVVDTVDKEGKHISPLTSPLSRFGKTEVFYKTKGDANNTADSEFVAKNQIIGTVLFHFPSLGQFSSFIKSIPGFLSLIVLPTLMFIGMELFNIKREIEKEVERKTIRKVQMYGIRVTEQQ